MIDLKSCGVLYFAFGYDYLIMALHSAETVKNSNPELKITIVTNIVVKELEDRLISELKICDKLISVDKGDELNRFEKTRAYDYSEYERTLYLDCDTEVCGDITPLFLTLDYFDIALKMNLQFSIRNKVKRIARKEYANQILDNGMGATTMSVWNGGMFVFNKTSSVESFFKTWNNLYIKQGGGLDQPTLQYALYTTKNLRMIGVNFFWNTFWTDYQLIKRYKHKKRHFDENNIKILHYNQPGNSTQIISKLLIVHNAIKDIVLDKTEQTGKIQIENYDIRYKLMSFKIINILNNNKLTQKIIKKIINKIYGKKIKLKRQASRL